MVTGFFHIKINSNEDNKDNGFYALITSGAHIICLDDEEYMVPKEAVDKLNQRKISYEVVVEKKEESKEKGSEKNATETKV